MGILQVGVQPIERVAIAIVVDADDLRAVVIPPRGDGVRQAALVDIVADMYDEIQILLRHIAIGCIEALAKILTGSQREPVRPVARAGKSPRAPDTTCRAQRTKLIEEPPIGRQTGYQHVYRVAVSRKRCSGALPDDISHTGVRSDFPSHQNRPVRHAAAVEWIGRQARPQHGRMESRITRGHTEREQAGLGRSGATALQDYRRSQEPNRSADALQKASARQAAAWFFRRARISRIRFDRVIVGESISRHPGFLLFLVTGVRFVRAGYPRLRQLANGPIA